MEAKDRRDFLVETRHAIMHAAAWLTVAGIAVAELVQMEIGLRFALTALLLLCFAGLLALVFRLAYSNRDRAFIPVAAAAALVIVAVMIFGANPQYGAILFFILCTVVAIRLPVPYAFSLCGAAMLSLLGCSLFYREPDWLPTTLSFSTGFFAFAAFGITIRNVLQARAESQQLLEELRNAESRLREMAVMQERQRLAREMHDAVGHRLSASAVLLEGAARLIPSDPQRATRMVETSRAQVREGLAELRTAVTALRDGTVPAQPIREALGTLVEMFRQGCSAAIHLDVQEGIREPEPEWRHALIRTAQEALTNVQKHSRATRVDLRLAESPEGLVLTCRDNGVGAGARGGPGGYGLSNLRERAAALGGRMDFESETGGGALLRFALPPRGGAVHG